MLTCKHALTYLHPHMHTTAGGSGFTVDECNVDSLRVWEAGPLYVFVRVSVCACARVCLCVRAHVRLCECARGQVFCVTRTTDLEGPGPPHFSFITPPLPHTNTRPRLRT